MSDYYKVALGISESSSSSSSTFFANYGHSSSKRCPNCHQKFMSAEMVKVHLENCQKGNSLKKVKRQPPEEEESAEVDMENERSCNICMRQFGSPRGLKVHQRKHRREREREDVVDLPYKCSQCHYQCNSERVLALHAKVHAKKRKERPMESNARKSGVPSVPTMSPYSSHSVPLSANAALVPVPLHAVHSSTRRSATAISPSPPSSDDIIATPAPSAPSRFASSHSSSNQKASSSSAARNSMQSSAQYNRKDGNTCSPRRGRPPKKVSKAATITTPRTGRRQMANSEYEMEEDDEDDENSGQQQYALRKEQKKLAGRPRELQPRADFESASNGLAAGSAIVSHYAGMVVSACAQSNLVTFHDVNTAQGTIGKITFQFQCNKCRGELGVARCYKGRAYCVICCGHPDCD